MSGYKLERLARGAEGKARSGTPREAAARAEALAARLPEARIVSAFNTVPSEVLFGVFAARRRRSSRPSLVYCGDEANPKRVAARLIRGGPELAYRFARLGKRPPAAARE